MRIVLLFVALAALAVGCRGNVFSLEVGDCFNDPGDGYGEEITDVKIVECSESHDNEVYAMADYPASDSEPFPGLRAIESYADKLCADRFEGYVGAPYDHSRLDATYFYPVAEGWERLDDREITCFLYEPNSEKLNSSMKGSGR